MGESRAGNLLKALELCFHESSKARISFPDMVERLREYYEEVDVKEMSIELCRKDAVRLMNLHKAKGLEAPVVFLTYPLKDGDYYTSTIRLVFFIIYHSFLAYRGFDDILGEVLFPFLIIGINLNFVMNVEARIRPRRDFLSDGLRDFSFFYKHGKHFISKQEGHLPGINPWEGVEDALFGKTALAEQSVEVGI